MDTAAPVRLESSRLSVTKVCLILCQNTLTVVMVVRKDVYSTVLINQLLKEREEFYAYRVTWFNYYHVPSFTVHSDIPARNTESIHCI